MKKETKIFILSVIIIWAVALNLEEVYRMGYKNGYVAAKPYLTTRSWTIVSKVPVSQWRTEVKEGYDCTNARIVANKVLGCVNITKIDVE